MEYLYNFVSIRTIRTMKCGEESGRYTELPLQKVLNIPFLDVDSCRLNGRID